MKKIINKKYTVLTAVVLLAVAVFSFSKIQLALAQSFRTSDGVFDIFRGNNPSLSTGWTDPVPANVGHRVQGDVRAWNTDEGTIAHYTKVRLDIPSTVATSHTVTAHIWADDAAEITDTLVINTTVPTRLVYVPGHAVVGSPSCPNDCPINDDALIGNGVTIGDILSGSANSASVTFKIDVIAPPVADRGLTCLPAETQNATIGQTVNFSVVDTITREPVSVTWSAPGGNPNAGTGTTFSTSYSAVGSYSVEPQRFGEYVFVEGCDVVITATPTPTPTNTPTATPTATPTVTPTPTATPVYACNSTCTTDAQCGNGMMCSSNRCRAVSCREEEDCTCNSTATPTSTPTNVPSPVLGTTEPKALPKTGSEGIVFVAASITSIGAGIYLFRRFKLA